MGYKLDIGYTEIDREKFIVEYNHNQGLLITENEYGIFAASDSEEIQNGIIKDISETAEYKAKVLAKQNEVKKEQLQAEIEAFDVKSIRALREGGVKDTATGQSWVEYYTSQISALREEIAGL